MVRCLRSALLWLGLIALPLHGMAGATMRVCLSEGSDMAASVAQAGAMTASATASGEDMASPADSPMMAKIKCGGAGAVCFASVALPATPLVIAAAGPAAAPANLLPVSVVHFFTGGPERPPRRFLA